VLVDEQSLSFTPSAWIFSEILSLCEFGIVECCVELFVEFFFFFFTFRPGFPFGVESRTGSVVGGRFDILNEGRSLGSVMSHDDLRGFKLTVMYF
jgi:hypothetical protein